MNKAFLVLSFVLLCGSTLLAQITPLEFEGPEPVWYVVQHDDNNTEVDTIYDPYRSIWQTNLYADGDHVYAVGATRSREHLVHGSSLTKIDVSSGDVL